MDKKRILVYITFDEETGKWDIQHKGFEDIPIWKYVMPAFNAGFGMWLREFKANLNKLTEKLPRD